MKEVIKYATENYQLRELKTDLFFESVAVNKAAERELFQEKKINVRLLAPKKSVLLEKEEEIELRVQQMKELEAPVKEGEQLGSVLYTLHGETIAEYPIVSVESVKRIDFFWIFSKIMELYLK